MRQHEIGPVPGSRHKRKRVGRGDGSGHGSQSGRGAKGQKSRAGAKIPPYFEGGQLPLSKRLPRQPGFTNIFRQEYAVVNLKDLARFDEGAEINPESLVQAGLLHSLKQPVKILGEGEISHPLTVKAHRFSQSAKEKIAAAGGQAEEI